MAHPSFIDLQKAPRIERVVPGEEAVRDFRGILQGLAVGKAIASAVHFLMQRHNRIIETGIGSVPVMFVALNAGQLVHFAHGVAAIVRHQIRNAPAFLERHLTATLGHAVEEGVSLERGQFHVLRSITIPDLWIKCFHILCCVGRLCREQVKVGINLVKFIIPPLHLLPGEMLKKVSRRAFITLDSEF